MIIKYHKNFEKQFKKLTSKQKTKTIEIISLFQENPFNEKLKNHCLHGKLKGKKSITVANDLKIIFEEFDSYTLIIFLDLGTHNKVY